MAAASYTLVAALQKASGFIVLILFTRVLSPDEYGEVALLATVGVLVAMLMTLGLEPRITYAYFRAGDRLPEYLLFARRGSTLVPFVFAAVSALAILSTPLDNKSMWIMECVGACLLAAGTTFAYAVLRAARRAGPYMGLALGILVTQVATRVVFVVVLDWGPTGWAASDLVSGAVALAMGTLVAASATPVHRTDGHFTTWGVLREGLPLIPHYLAQWGLSLSDRIILAFFVSTSDVGIYASIYQVAAVISMVLNEVNRAFMPSYAQHEPGAEAVQRLVALHLRVTFALYAVMLLVGLAAVALVLPAQYRVHDALFPVLSLGALLYGLYFIPMNALTLVAGITSKAPIISMTALFLNVGINLALDSLWGVWGAAVGTVVGYGALAAIALWFERGVGAVRWSQVRRVDPKVCLVYLPLVASSLFVASEGLLRFASLGLVLAALIVILVSFARLPMPLRGTDAF